MADISTWSPVDESNNQPPPDGWPENQSPSSVNNCARAMMGAVRRFYDQIIAGTLSLPYLPITGGTVTGNITANVVTGQQLTSNGNVDVAGTVTATTGHFAGDITGNVISSNQLTSNGNINSAGLITAGGGLTSASNITGNVLTGNAVNSNGNLGVAGTGNIAGDLGVAGTVFAHAFVDTDGLYSVFDTLRDLEARVAALEEVEHAR